MTQRLTRMTGKVLMTAVAFAALAALMAQPASAQYIGLETDGIVCGGNTEVVPFDLNGAPFASFAQNATCTGTRWSERHNANELLLDGTGVQDMSAETCSLTSGDTVLYLYQSAGGGAGAFSTGDTCNNRIGFDDDGCNPQSRASATGEGGFFTVVVSPWWLAADNFDGDILVESDTCVFNAPLVEALPVTFAEPTELPCITGEAIINIEVCNTGGDALPNVPGQPEYGVNIVSSTGAPIEVRSITSAEGPGQSPGVGVIAARGYNSGTADLSLAPGACDVVSHVVYFPTGVGNVGSLTIDRAVWWDSQPNGAIDTGDGFFEFLGADEDPIELPCEPRVFPEIQLGCQVHLPILNFQGQDDVCETWIEVQNLGCDFAKAALITWGEPGFCPPQAAGPLKVECTGMLKPGSTWNLLGAQVPTGSKSGILFKFTTRQLSEIGVDLGFDDITGDYLCETLFFGVVGDADDYRRFKKAYNENLEFAGVPLDRAKGDGRLAVDVHRTCPGDTTPGVEVTSKYNGLAADELGTWDDLFGGFGFYVPLIYADAADFNTILYIQNGGLQCSSVEVWFKARDDCLRASICEILTLAPGETYQLDANDCVGPDFQGSAWLRSSQVMGIAVDIIGRDVLMTYVAEPAEINYTFDPNQAVTRTAQQVAFGPLIYSEYQGWDTGIQVQNMSGVTAAKVKVYFLDRSGDIITTLVDWVCPRGSQTFFLPVIFDLPGNWVGTVRVESQEWFSPGNPLVLPPNITAVATLIKYNDAARTETTEAIAYNLLPEHKIYDWQIGYGGGGLDSGVGLIAIPSLLRDLQGSGLTSELAIANVVPKPGFTDFVIYFYDQNGLLDYICQKLNEKQVEYIDLQTWGYINEGFKGSAIISAWFWEHDVFDDQGGFLRNLVGLGAVAIERKGTRLGEDVPGDEAAGSRGIPFRQFETEDDSFEFCFMGYPPLCPGFIDTRFGEGGEVCLPGFEAGPFMNDFGTSTAVVPLWFGACSQSATPQAYMIGGLTGDGTPFTGRNCSGGAQDITVDVDQGSCSGGGAGLLLTAYQDVGNPDNPQPFDPTDVCNNVIAPTTAFAINSISFTVAPGYWQVLVQTNFIGQTCSNGISGTITVN